MAGLSQKKKNLFANAIIVVCLSVCIFLAVSIVYEYHRLDTVVPAGVLGVFLGFFGSELGILAARQILGTDLPSKTSKKSKPADDEDEINFP